MEKVSYIVNSGFSESIYFFQKKLVIAIKPSHSGYKLGKSILNSLSKRLYYHAIAFAKSLQVCKKSAEFDIILHIRSAPN